MGARKVSLSELKGGSTLLRNDHFSIRLLQSLRIVVLTRTDQAFQTAAEVDRGVSEFIGVLPPKARNGLRMLIDMRLGPIRVHPSLDPAFERFRKETQLGFARAVVVVATPLGRVRAERLAEHTALRVGVFGSMEEALEFLTVE